MCLPVYISISIGTCTQRTITVRDFCLNYIFWNKPDLTEQSHMLTVPEAKKQTELFLFESIPFNDKIIITCISCRALLKISLLRMS